MVEEEGREECRRANPSIIFSFRGETSCCDCGCDPPGNVGLLSPLLLDILLSILSAFNWSMNIILILPGLFGSKQLTESFVVRIIDILRLGFIGGRSIIRGFCGGGWYIVVFVVEEGGGGGKGLAVEEVG